MLCSNTDRTAVAVGAISALLMEVFHDFPANSGLVMALGSTQPLTEMSTRGISFG